MKKLILLVTTILSFSPAADLIADQVTGEVNLTRKEKKSALKKGRSLKTGDVISTGKESIVELIAKKEYRIKILESSEFMVTEKSGPLNKLKFEKGDILVNVSKLWAKKSDFQIATPVAVAAVRGTQFWGQVRPEKETGTVTFAVREGQVSFKLGFRKEPVTVSTGEALVVNQKEETVLLRKASAGELAAMAGIDQMPLE